MVDSKKGTDRELSKYNCDSILQRFSVSFDYPVYFTRNVFSPENELLLTVINRLHEDRRHRTVVYVDSGLAELQPSLIPNIKDYFDSYSSSLSLAESPYFVPGGAHAKSEMEIVRGIMTTIGDLHLDRQSYVIAVGGGSVLDMVGFSASLVHRGLRLIRIPSTTLAQDDAGIGIKNGMDIHGQKNFVGTFAPPFAVLNDFSLLSTLSDKDWIGGVAEAFKVAIIKDTGFFDFLCDNAGKIRNRNQPVIEKTIRCCAAIHLEHIRNSGDPFESGSARPLDFGHWAGHQLENMSNYTLGHGQAVAVGIALDSTYAEMRGLISETTLQRIIKGLSECGLSVWHDLLLKRAADGRLQVLDGLKLLREHLGGPLNITLPDGLGKRIEVGHINGDLVEDAVDFLRKHK